MKPTSLAKCLAFLLSGFFLSAPAVSQATEQDLCEAALSDFSWMLGEEAQYHHLNSDEFGQKLIGLKCSEAEITDWFKRNSWTLLKTVSPSGKSFGHGSRSYQADRSLVFCRPRHFPLRWLTNGCSAQASVSLLEGKITDLTAGPSI